MKKLISLLLCLLMVFALAACGQTKAPETQAPAIGNDEPTNAPIELTLPERSEPETTVPAIESDADKVAAYVEAYGDTVVAGIESGMGRQNVSTIRAEDCSIIIDIRIDELENLTEAAKAALQETYNAMEASFEPAYIQLKEEVPELKYLIINVTDKNGEIAATILCDGIMPETTATTPVGDSAADKVKAYVDSYGDALATGMESSFTSSGMTCTSSVEAIDCGIVVTICINELENVDDATKAALQETYDAMAAEFQTVLAGAQQGLPELQYLTYKVCDKNGDVLATIHID